MINVDFMTFDLFEPNNKFKVLHHDIINDKFEIILSKRDNLQLSGFVDIISKNIYGYSKNKKQYKLFKPFNKCFPHFLVNVDNNIYNKIITIKFKNWIYDFPIGINICSHGIISPYNDLKIMKNIFSQALLNYNGFYQLKKNNKVDININFFTQDELIHSCDKYSISEFDIICNIDPPFCLDIDDVISYNSKSELIGIHIVDLISILGESINLIHDNIYFNNIFNTTYADNHTYNIIPENIINNYLSLNPNQQRNVWSIYININTHDITIKKEIITNKISYTYDQADIILFNNQNNYLSIINNFCISFGYNNYKSIYDNYENHKYNSHYMIAILMIITNNFIGNLLCKDNNMIYKISSKYIINNNDNFHENLNLHNYTNFTSPIRRYIDQYIHILLHKKYNLVFKLEDRVINEEMLLNINRSINEFKLISNKFKILKLVNFLGDDQIINGILVKIEFTNKTLKLKWKIDNDINIFDIFINPLLSDDKEFLINRLNECQKIPLILNKNYNLKLNISNNIKIYIMYN